MSDIKLWAAVALILSVHVAYTDASTMKIEASPANIYPILTKKLQIRCTVMAPVATTTAKPTTTPTTTKATTKAATTLTTTKMATTTTKPALTTTKPALTTTKPVSTTKANVSTTSATVNLTGKAINTTTTNAQTTSTTTTTTTKPTTTQPKTTTILTSPTTVNPTTSTQVDLTYLLSIVISKQNSATGKTETVASVAGRLAANAEVQYLGTVEVQGNTDNSTKSGEQGFLQLTWNYPLAQHGGNYICTASGLNSAKQTVSLSTSVQIAVTQPNISDLVSYISDHDKSLTDLQLQASQQSQSTQDMKLDMEELEANLTQETTELFEEADGLPGRTIQSGSSGCYNNYIYFPTMFNATPVVFLSVSSLNFYYNYWYGGVESTWQVLIQDVTQSYFVFNCNNNNYLTIQNVDWVAMY
ncbi:uncharacterized protein LOC131945078 isoform X2 [Physella acuta]|uniref:uncharacterized protein LOC131945078 isoform X2 n=1 Tax=Physella acuta TaxID=109671 RepID=UPI0027DD455C|nr:uncharacterized protein LOC131945078 isoform X2 [Physella acuta]